MSVFNRDGVWVVKWKNGAGRWQQQRTTCPTKAEARALLRKLESKAEHQRLGLEPLAAPTAMTFAELLTWHAEAFPRGGTSDRLLATRHLAALGTLPLVELTGARIDEVLTAKEEELAPKTLNNLRGWIHGVFSKAIARGVWNGSNPAVTVPRRKVPKRVPTTLRAEEVRALLENVPTRWRGIFATAVYTAMRRGEIVALQKRDVDLEGGTILVTRSWEADTTKGQRARLIPLHPELKPYLAEAMRQSPSELVFSRPDGAMHAEHTDFPSLLRSALNRAQLVDGWTLKCRRCRHHEKSATADVKPCPKCGFALWPAPVPRRVRFHDLRHTTATLLLKAGFSLAVVQRVLGHTDPAITANTYGHLDLDDMRSALGALSFAPPEALPVPEVAGVAPVVALAASAETVETEPADPESSPHGAPVVRNLAEAPRARRSTGSEPQRMRGVLPSGPTRIRTWNQAVMSPGSAPWQGVAGGGMGAYPIGISRGEGWVPVAERGRDSARSTGRGAPVVRKAARGGVRRGGGGRALAAVAEVFTVAEVAELLKVCTATVYAMVRRGELEHFRVVNSIRVPREAVERLRR